jgi:hypothetical protein
VHNLVGSRGTQGLEFPGGLFESVSGSERPRPFNANLNGGCGVSLCWITGLLGKYRIWDNGEGGKKD